MTHLYQFFAVSINLVVPDVTLFVTDRADAKWSFAVFGDVKREVRAASASAMLRSIGDWNCESFHEDSDIAIKEAKLAYDMF